MKLPTREESRVFIAVTGIAFVSLGLLEFLFDFRFWLGSKWIGFYGVILKYFGQHGVSILWILIGFILLTLAYINRRHK